jgi:hypothetical protein
MLRRLALAVCSALLVTAASEPSRTPVLVELFTSEGCSSCPPADRLLQRLDSEAIVLSEHVDYWDHQGWKDRFSSHAFTVRQESYARRFGLDSSYTPEMVIDGAAEFNGSDSARATQEIAKAARRPRAQVNLTRLPAGGLRIEVDSAPASGDVMLALADPAAQSQVAAGENKGRSLTHVAIARSLRKVGSVKHGIAFRNEITLPPDAAAQRIVVFVQEDGQARVSGAAVLAPAAASYKPAP